MKEFTHVVTHFWRWCHISIPAAAIGYGAYVDSSSTRTLYTIFLEILGASFIAYTALVMLAGTHKRGAPRVSSLIVGGAIGSVLMLGALLYAGLLATTTALPVSPSRMVTQEIVDILLLCVVAMIGLGIGLIIGLGDGVTLLDVSPVWGGVGLVALVMGMVALTTHQNVIEQGRFFGHQVSQLQGGGLVALGTIVFWSGLWSGGWLTTRLLPALERFVTDVGAEIKKLAKYMTGYSAGYFILVSGFTALFSVVYQLDRVGAFTRGHGAAPAITLPELFYFSAMTFPPLGYSELRPHSFWAQAGTTLESVIGAAWTLVVFSALLRAVDTSDQNGASVAPDVQPSQFESAAPMPSRASQTPQPTAAASLTPLPRGTQLARSLHGSWRGMRLLWVVATAVITAYLAVVVDRRGRHG